MNLMNVLTCKWDDRLLAACGGESLRSKLGPEPVAGGSVVGTLAPYWASRYGFSSACLVAPFTGDNPATVVAASTPGDAILSLGTSTTLLISIPHAESAPARFTTSHLLAHPTTPGAQIAMLCYKNGALAREQVRDAHAGGDWTRFNELVEASSPGNDGQIGLYFPLPEIIPAGVSGDHFFITKDGKVEPVESLPDASHPRAILESQFLSIRARIAAVMPADAPPLQRLILSGGSAQNAVIRQLASDVFDMRAYVPDGTHQGAGTGGAMLALFAWWRANVNARGTFEELVAGTPDSMRLVASPKREVAEVYAKLVDVYMKAEDEVVRVCEARRVKA
jgi:xylulokinase